MSEFTNVFYPNFNCLSKSKVQKFLWITDTRPGRSGAFLMRWILLLLILLGFEKVEAAPHAARQGVVDLQNLVPGQPLHLDGEWMFFWNEALSPQEFLQRLNEQGPAPKIAEIGKSFSEIVGDTVVNGHGYSTYAVRFTSIDPETMRDLWLAGGQFYTSARGYFFSVNGEGMTDPIFKAGTFGTSQDTSHPRLADSHASRLRIRGQEDHFLLIHVANFHMSWGGI
jgi:hypothetical protein